MSMEKRLQIKVVNAVGEMLKGVKALRDVSIEVAAECEPGDKDAEGIVAMVSQISTSMLPLEIMHRQMEKKFEEN